MDDVMLGYCNAALVSNPKAILIERFRPPELTSGGLIMPTAALDRETVSGFWAKLLKVSEAPADSERTVTLQDYYRNLIGNYVLFRPENPINGGLNGNAEQKRIQIMALGEILLTLKPEDFFRYIVSQYVGLDKAMELYGEAHAKGNEG